MHVYFGTLRNPHVLSHLYKGPEIHKHTFCPQHVWIYMRGHTRENDFMCYVLDNGGASAQLSIGVSIHTCMSAAVCEIICDYTTMCTHSHMYAEARRQIHGSTQHRVGVHVYTSMVIHKDTYTRKCLHVYARVFSFRFQRGREGCQTITKIIFWTTPQHGDMRRIMPNNCSPERRWEPATTAGRAQGRRQERLFDRG